MSGLNPRQIGLLRDFRSQGFMAFFVSPFRLEGPGLRDLGMIGGIGDSTAITAAGMDAIREADAALSRKIAEPDTYRGWTISQGRWPEPAWSATGPNYDAWTEGEGEWSDNGEKADAPNREALIVEIDAWFEERGA